MRAKATYHVSRFTLSFPDWLAIVGFVCLGRFLFFVWVVFFWSIRSQENVVYYDLVWIRKIATVVTMSAAIGQKKQNMKSKYAQSTKMKLRFFFPSVSSFFSRISSSKISSVKVRCPSIGHLCEWWMEWLEVRCLIDFAGGQRIGSGMIWASRWFAKFWLIPRTFGACFAQGSYESWQFEKDHTNSDSSKPTHSPTFFLKFNSLYDSCIFLKILIQFPITALDHHVFYIFTGN